MTVSEEFILLAAAPPSAGVPLAGRACSGPGIVGPEPVPTSFVRSVRMRALELTSVVTSVVSLVVVWGPEWSRDIASSPTGSG